jgi:hypothetical protein
MLDPFAVEPDLAQSSDMAEALSRAIELRCRIEDAKPLEVEQFRGRQRSHVSWISARVGGRFQSGP